MLESSRLGWAARILPRQSGGAPDRGPSADVPPAASLGAGSSVLDVWHRHSARDLERAVGPPTLHGGPSPPADAFAFTCLNARRQRLLVARVAGSMEPWGTE